MAKKVTAVVKLQLPAGKATPAPPVGPALGATGINIMAFCKDYNEKTSAQVGTIIPVEITVYSDRSFTYILKTPLPTCCARLLAFSVVAVKLVPKVLAQSPALNYANWLKPKCLI